VLTLSLYYTPTYYSVYGEYYIKCVYISFVIWLTHRTDFIPSAYLKHYVHIMVTLYLLPLLLPNQRSCFQTLKIETIFSSETFLAIYRLLTEPQTTILYTHTRARAVT